MIYTIERRKGKDMGSLVTWYEVRSYVKKSEINGFLLGGETLMEFKTKREAKKYCEEQGVEIYEEG